MHPVLCLTHELWRRPSTHALIHTEWSDWECKLPQGLSCQVCSTPLQSTLYCPARRFWVSWFCRLSVGSVALSVFLCPFLSTSEGGRREGALVSSLTDWQVFVTLKRSLWHLPLFLSSRCMSHTTIKSSYISRQQNMIQTTLLCTTAPSLWSATVIFFFACGYCHNTFYLAHRNPKIWNDPNFCASSLIICALSRCVWIAEIFVHLTTMHISSHVSCHVFLCWRQAVIYQGSNQLGHTGVLHKRGTESHCLGNELGNYWYSLNGVSNLFSLWMYCSILWA